jgi:exonuclease VII small subunit
MATFEAQVEGLTSLSIAGGTAPTQTELTQFLTDGAKEIINILPPNLLDWCASEETFTSTVPNSESETMNTGKILRVYRSDGDFDRVCRRIRADDKGHVTDPDDMGYASVTDPVFYTQNNKINVLPEGGSCKYDEVQYPAVAFGDSAIAVFPDEAEYLVVLYGCIKSLQNSLGAINITTFSLSASAPATIPSAPSISGGSVSPITIAALPTAPSYSPPAVGGATESLTTTMDADSSGSGTDADFLNFSKWFSVAGDLIEDQEDVELANAQIQKISTYLNSYQLALTDSLNTFNEANAVYQAGVQRNLEQSRINMQDAQKEADMALQAAIQDYTLELNRVSADASKYQALVSAEVQTYSQQIAEKTQEYQWMSGRIEMFKTDYESGVQKFLSGYKD